jgi:hypothetical protein
MTKTRLPLAFLLALLLGIGACLPPGTAVAAANEAQAAPTASELAKTNANANAQFRLDWSATGSRVQITVHADRLDDLYAFEMNLHVDAAKLRLTKAELPAKGFALEPKIDGDTVKLVFTKTGSVSGESGSMKLATLTFERIGAGQALLSLPNVSLVDSKLNRLDFLPGADMVIPAHAGGFPFPDTAGHWAEAIVREAVEQGWVDGYEDGTFRPDRPVTREQLAALLVRAFGLTADESEPRFADAAAIADWAKPYAAAVQAIGLMGGYEDGAFRPDRPVTRAELSVVLSRALGLPAGDEAALSGFADQERIPAWMPRPAPKFARLS